MEQHLVGENILEDNWSNGKQSNKSKNVTCIFNRLLSWAMN